MKISAVIPTYNRRDSLAQCLSTLSDQDLPHEDYEVVVVVDGSNDGTVEMLRALQPPHELVVVLLEENRGLAAARNAGAIRANGEILLFLDDDLSCDRCLLSTHWAAHGAGVVEKLIIGPIFPASDRPLCFASEERATELRKYFESLRRVAKPQWPDHVCAGANCSMRRTMFFECDGYDEGRFARRTEDVDLGVRLWKQGVEFRFEPRATTTHRWNQSDLQVWKHLEAEGAATVALCQKHPELRSRFGFAGVVSAPAWKRGAARVLASAPAYPVILVLRMLATLSERMPNRSGVRRIGSRLHRACRTGAILAGARREAGSWRALLKFFGPRLPVLLYHDIGLPTPTAENPSLTIRPIVFERHLRCLRRLGYTSISASQWLAWLEKGTPIPDKPILLTFDDGCANLAENALPVLVRYGFSATIFVITGRSSWVGLPLMTMDQIKHWFARGFEIGGHSRTHPKLTALGATALHDQVSGCRMDLIEAGMRPVSFAYPKGLYDKEVRSAVGSNFQIAFTTDEGLNDLRTDLLLMRRTMVRPGDTLLDVVLRARFGRSAMYRARTYLRLRSRIRRLVQRIRRFYY
jgi:GT2 family glycosyltransferase/peptidoglycan/xylan/chitin deacetylase (PgdA/CDA1 family)